MHLAPFQITEPSFALEVYELQQLAYPIEAELIGLPSIPPLLDTPETLQACGEQFIGCVESEQLVGAVSYKLVDEGEGVTLDIHRMMVHPERFRRGIASRLLESVLAVPGIRKAIVSTGTRNTPAVSLYERYAFRPVGIVEIAPDVTITKFEQTL
jgi:ribosomal protein S18 acetylase RimI-like enzyme